MAKRKAKRTNKTGLKKWKRVMIVVVAVVTVGAIVYGARLFKKDDNKAPETEKTLVAQDYDRNVLDDTTGIANTEDQSGISTSAYYRLSGLKISLAENAKIKYQVNYYDADKEFLGVKTLEKDYGETEMNEAKELGAVWVKIEIIPTEDDDGIVSALEKSNYVKQLTVEVSTVEVEEETEESADTSTEESETTSSSAE